MKKLLGWGDLESPRGGHVWQGIGLLLIAWGVALFVLDWPRPIMWLNLWTLACGAWCAHVGRLDARRARAQKRIMDGYRQRERAWLS